MTDIEYFIVSPNPDQIRSICNVYNFRNHGGWVIAVRKNREESNSFFCAPNFREQIKWLREGYNHIPRVTAINWWKGQLGVEYSPAEGVIL